jgi:hypothetical protein
VRRQLFNSPSEQGTPEDIDHAFVNFTPKTNLQPRGTMAGQMPGSLDLGVDSSIVGPQSNKPSDQMNGSTSTTARHPPSNAPAFGSNLGTLFGAQNPNTQATQSTFGKASQPVHMQMQSAFGRP